MRGQLLRRIALLLTAIAAMIATTAQAVIYTVNRSFTDVSFTCTVVGTLAIPLGDYTIEGTIHNPGASPFTSIHLSLTANGVTCNLTSAVTYAIYGTGQFIINASPTTLTFSTANADGFNPALLKFSDPLRDEYTIGSDAEPGLEAGHFYVGGADYGAPVIFPVVFGTAVPEPSTFFLAAMTLFSFGGLSRV